MPTKRRSKEATVPKTLYVKTPTDTLSVPVGDAYEIPDLDDLGGFWFHQPGLDGTAIAVNVKYIEHIELAPER